MRTNQKGYTLVEVIATIVIVSIVMTLTYNSIFSLTRYGDKLYDRHEAYSNANILSQSILNHVHNLGLERSSTCPSATYPCIVLTNRAKYYIDDNGDEQTKNAVSYILKIENNYVTLLDDNNQSLVSVEVSSTSTISTTCINQTCDSAVITLDLTFDLIDANQYQSITTLAH